MPDSLSLYDVINQEDLASQIADKYMLWQSSRHEWRTRKDELLAYLFANDSTHTSAHTTPWKNKTTRPKLCQIRDNLHANYINALFPNSNWLTWLPEEINDPMYDKKKKAILRYMYSKINHPKSRFKETVSRLVLDYIDYGTVFGMGNTYYAPSYETDESVVLSYQGPKLRRLSPIDIVIDPTATDLDSTPKIHREVISLGDLHQLKTSTVEDYNKAAINKALRQRKNVVDNMSAIGDMGDEHVRKQFTVAGFSSPDLYFLSDSIEILTFYGSLWDGKKFHHNRIIKVADKSTIIQNIPNYSTNGSPLIRATGWRLRPDILWAMGPLDNLVGMQYRIDHLENMAADAWDGNAYPTWFVQGDTVNAPTGKPGEIIYGDTDSRITALSPNLIVSNNDLKIRELEEAMEEYAGAPRQAMGIRTPGEKTKFEVQTLENNASRVFQLKAAWFEEQHLEPLLNDMLDAAARNIGTSGEQFVYKDPTTGISETITITKEDLNLKGYLRPMGARHFAEKANRFQNMMAYQQQSRPEVWQYFDPQVWASIDADSLDLTRYGVLREPDTDSVPEGESSGPAQSQPGVPGLPS
jgi:hypothetical protein